MAEHSASQDLPLVSVLESPLMDVSSGKACPENEDFVDLNQSDESIEGDGQLLNLNEFSVGEMISNKLGVSSDVVVSSNNNDADKQEDESSNRFGILRDSDDSVKISGERSPSEICLPSVSCGDTISDKDTSFETFGSVKEKDNRFMKLEKSLSGKIRSRKPEAMTSEIYGDDINLEPLAVDSMMYRQYSMSKLNTEGADLEPRASTSGLNRQLSMSKLNAEAPAFVPKGLMPFSMSAGEVYSPRSPNPSVLMSSAMPQSPHSVSQQLETYYVTTSGFHAPVVIPGSSPSFSAGGSLATRLSGTTSASRSLQPIGLSSTECFSVGFTPERGEGSEICPTQEENFSQEMVSNPASGAKSTVSEELKSKIAKQVEFYFSDSNLPTDNYLMKFVKKDPDGFVPLPVVASFKKVKSLSKNHSVVAAALRTSSLLVVSEDGKRVRRAEPLPDIDLKEIQSRSVVVENLPEDHSIRNMEQLFGTVGNVKLVRICQPEAANGVNQTAAKFSRTDLLVSNKLHAVVEYESVEEAERAVAELTDERNWRSGLRVRLLVRRTGKYGYPHLAKGRKLGAEAAESNETEEDGATCNGALEKFEDEQSQQTEMEEHLGDAGLYERDGRRGRGRNRGRGRGRGQHIPNTSRGHSRGTPLQSSSSSTSDFIVKPPPGPRMPDGTRGFTMGRGKLLPTDTS